MASRLFFIYLSMLTVIVAASSSGGAFLKYFVDPSVVPESFKQLSKFRFFFFTLWNFTLQIIFLILAVSDEVSKLADFPKIHRKLEKIRLLLFSTIVFPSSLMVVTVFWTIWHIDRELIFPKAIDEFYPSWLNHTLHTLILVPLIVEVIVQMKNVNYRISRKTAAITLGVYCTVYQVLYLSVYFRHGIWLYPIYKVLTWTQRIAFFVGQFFMGIVYQQIGISLLTSSSGSMKVKAK